MNIAGRTLERHEAALTTLEAIDEFLVKFENCIKALIIFWTDAGVRLEGLIERIKDLNGSSTPKFRLEMIEKQWREAADAFFEYDVKVASFSVGI
jgi:hypothetical protein